MLRFVSKNIGDDPDAAQVGNQVELGGVLEMLAGRDIPGENKSVNG